MSTEELLALVLRLPRQDRARLVEELLASLEEADDEDVAAAWAPELQRRSREVAEGKVQPVAWDTARAGILEDSSVVVRIELHPEARAELRAAALWYDERRPTLGDDLVAEVSSVLDRIGEAPASFPVWPATSAAPSCIHRAVVNRFPYVIAFEVHPEHALVLAIAHAKRRPSYWLERAF